MEFINTYNVPFSASNDPKIPDGRCTESRGLALKRSKQIIETSPSDGKWLLVMPGLAFNWKYLGSYFENPSNFDNYAATYDVVQFDDQYTGGAGPVNPVEKWWAWNKGALSTWRIVSSGIKLSSVKSAGIQDGYWKACCVQVPTQQRFYKWFEKPDEGAGFIPVSINSGGTSAPLFQAWLEKIEMEKLPSFRSGKIKDLNNTEFALPVHNHMHSFTQIIENMSIVDYSLTDIIPNSLRTGVDFDGYNLWQNMISKFYDENYMMWIIKFEGMTQTPTWNIESAHNLEVTYHPQFDEAALMTAARQAKHVNMRNYPTTLTVPGAPEPVTPSPHKRKQDSQRPNEDDTDWHATGEIHWDLDQAEHQLAKDIKEHPLEALDLSSLKNRAEEFIDKELSHSEKQWGKRKRPGSRR